MVKERVAVLPESSNYETERNKPMPSPVHAAIQANLIVALNVYRKLYRAYSELSLELSEWVSVPDIALFAWKPLNTYDLRTKESEIPLCVIEILSPTQSLGELRHKIAEYFERGIKSCWLVLPGLDNVYVFEAPDQYEMYKKGETLKDKQLNIAINVSPIFE